MRFPLERLKPVAGGHIPRGAVIRRGEASAEKTNAGQKENKPFHDIPLHGSPAGRDAAAVRSMGTCGRPLIFSTRV